MVDWLIVIQREPVHADFIHQANSMQSSELNRMIAEGEAMLATTIVGGRTVWCVCQINPRTQFNELSTTLDRLEQYSSEMQGQDFSIVRETTLIAKTVKSFDGPR